MKRLFSIELWQEGEWHLSRCPEIEVASQGETREEAIDNLIEAIDLLIEVGSEEEIGRRLIRFDKLEEAEKHKPTVSYHTFVEEGFVQLNVQQANP